MDIGAAEQRGVLANDTDPDGNPLTVSAVNGVPGNVGNPTATAQGGTVTLNADGTFTYTPLAGFSGVDTFTYTANDGAGGTDTATVSITVTGNVAPQNLTATNTVNGGLSINTGGANDAYLVADNGAALLGGRTALSFEIQFNSPSIANLEYPTFVSYATPTANDGIWFGAYKNGATEQIGLSLNGGWAPVNFDVDTLFDGNDHSVAFTWTQASGAWAIYVDGVQIGSGTGIATGQTISTGGSLVLAHDQDAGLGTYYFEPGNALKGTLYDIRFFDDVRTPAEILANHDATVPPAEPNLIANWTANDISTSDVLPNAVGGNNLNVQHVTQAGFTAGTPVLTLLVDENAANGTVVGTVTATDDVASGLTYSLVDSAGGRFAINPATGVITVANGALLDYETATSHNVTVRVTDGGGLTYDEVFNIALRDLADVSITGTVYNDVDGDAVVAEVGEGTFRNVTVRLYQDDGDGVIEATDAFVASTTTNASGVYTFTGLADATYWVTIDSRTIGNPLDVGYKVGFDATNVWAEQTYGDNPLTGGAPDLGARYGGLNAGTSDNAATGLTSAEHVARVAVSGANVTGVNSGFSYSAIVNTRGDTTDDDGSNPRMQQGSLRQFILNSNALSGVQTSSFAIAGAGVQTINLTAALPDVTDAVVLDAWTEGVYQGTPGYSGPPLVELNGGNVSAYGFHLVSGSSGSTVRGFVINRHNDGIGIDFSDNNVIQGNYIGTNSAGTVVVGFRNADDGIDLDNGSSNNTIGGTLAGERNVISGQNGGDGIVINGGASNNLVIGNYIGTDVTGTADLGNNVHGVHIRSGAANNTIGGTTTAERNVISGNAGQGVRIDGLNTENNVVAGNYIGTTAAGAAGIGNSAGGIAITNSAANNTIGGTAANAGNLIAHNTSYGINVAAAAGSGNAILGNAIHSNTTLGIDLQNDGVTPNDVGTGDSDGGPNNLQNHPVLASATVSGGNVIFIGTLDSTVGATFRLEFFANAVPTPGADASGNGEGQRYLGAATVTDGGAGDLDGLANGVISFNETVAGAAVSGEIVSATATNMATGDTSEFGANVTAVASQSISGTIIHDIDGDANVAEELPASRFAGATVRLYTDNATVGTIEAGDTLVATTVTDASGNYSFTGLANGNYWVVVDSSTLNSGAAYNAGYNSSWIWAEQTYGDDSTTGGAVDLGARYGGRNANTSDASVAGNPVGSEHVARISVSGANVTGVDYGFSFNAIVTTDDGDDTGDNRTVQGSLRQFILNSNAITNASYGIQSSNFSIGGGGLQTIAPAAAFANITDAVTLDATTQEGYAGTPLIQIDGAGAGALTNGFFLGAGSSGSTIRGFALYSFGNDAVHVRSDNNQILGNHLGTDAGGLVDFGNGGDGVHIGIAGTPASGNLVRGNVIIGNTSDGVVIAGAGTTGNRIQGNRIGVDVGNGLDGNRSGVRIQDGATGNTIGGTVAGDGNVIGGNLQDGVRIVDNSDDNRVQGNWIGTNSGGADLGNVRHGVWVEGGALATSSPTLIRIGGIGAGEPNTIAFNDGDGVLVSGSGTAYVLITANSIHSNGELGIDLAGGTEGASGWTANDAVGTWVGANHDPDTGPNKLQNYPSLSGAVWDGATLRLSGSLEATDVVTSYRIHVYASSAADASGHGEGERYLGAFDLANITGTALFTNQAIAPLAAVGAGDWITVTATATTGTDPSTSEFSVAMQATSPGSISGTVYEDVNGNGAVLDDGVGRDGVDVFLYRDGGDQVADGVDDVLVAATVTAGGGNYSFGGLIDARYWVVVDSKDVTASAGAAVPANVWAEQTYGDDWTTDAVDLAARYGGRNAAVSDNAAGLATAEHVGRAQVAGGGVAGMNFGFSFSAIVNTRGDALDDDGGGGRLQQGSLRQFILNSNAISGHADLELLDRLGRDDHRRSLAAPVLHRRGGRRRHHAGRLGRRADRPDHRPGPRHRRPVPGRRQRRQHDQGIDPQQLQPGDRPVLGRQPRRRQLPRHQRRGHGGRTERGRGVDELRQQHDRRHERGRAQHPVGQRARRGPDQRLPRGLGQRHHRKLHRPGRDRDGGRGQHQPGGGALPRSPEQHHRRHCPGCGQRDLGQQRRRRAAHRRGDLRQRRAGEPDRHQRRRHARGGQRLRRRDPKRREREYDRRERRCRAQRDLGQRHRSLHLRRGLDGQRGPGQLHRHRHHRQRRAREFRSRRVGPGGRERQHHRRNDRGRAQRDRRERQQQRQSGVELERRARQLPRPRGRRIDRARQREQQRLRHRLEQHHRRHHGRGTQCHLGLERLRGLRHDRHRQPGAGQLHRHRRDRHARPRQRRAWHRGLERERQHDRRDRGRGRQPRLRERLGRHLRQRERQHHRPGERGRAERGRRRARKRHQRNSRERHRESDRRDGRGRRQRRFGQRPRRHLDLGRRQQRRRREPDRDRRGRNPRPRQRAPRRAALERDHRQHDRRQRGGGAQRHRRERRLGRLHRKLER